MAQASIRDTIDKVRLYCTGVNLLATGQTAIVPVTSGRSFYVSAAWAVVRTLTGTLSIGPTITVGNNGSFNNAIIATLVPTTVVVGSVYPLTLPAAASQVLISLASTAISANVSIVGVATTMTADIHLEGFYL